MSNKTKILKALTLDINTSVHKARAFFKAEKIDFIPITTHDKYAGLLFENSLDKDLNDKSLNDVRYLLKDISLKIGFTFFDYYKLCSLYNITKIPLISEHDEFIKYISFKDVLSLNKHTTLSLELTTVLKINKETKSFTYSQLSQIIEAHGAKLLGSYIVESNEDITQVVVNILHSGLNELLQSLRRYEYDIVSYHEEDLHHETLKDNSNYLTKYLTV